MNNILKIALTLAVGIVLAGCYNDSDGERQGYFQDVVHNSCSLIRLFSCPISRLGISRTSFGSALGLTKTFVIGFYSVIFRMTAETGFIFKEDSPFFEVYFAPSPVP